MFYFVYHVPTFCIASTDRLGLNT